MGMLLNLHKYFICTQQNPWWQGFKLPFFKVVLTLTLCSLSVLVCSLHVSVLSKYTFLFISLLFLLFNTSFHIFYVNCLLSGKGS